MPKPVGLRVGGFFFFASFLRKSVCGGDAPPFIGPPECHIIGGEIGDKTAMIDRNLLRMGEDKDGDRGSGDDGLGNGVALQTRTRTKKPAMYKVLMLNDDYTPMEFVVHVLERFFSKNREAATAIMLQVHQRGVGVCGVFTYEVAETKVNQVTEFARRNQHPLRCTLEKD
jgi:ATP-dependent Clp protease adaptor protein ClpS